MNRQLWKLLLTANFGRAQIRPVPAAIIRLVIATMLALIMGAALANSIIQAHLPHDLPLSWLGAVVAVVSFTVSSLLLLAVGSSRDQASRRDMMRSLMAVWPLAHTTKWLLTIIPSLILLGILMVFGLPMVIALATATATPLLGLALATGLGTVCGLALAMSPWPASQLIRGLILIGLTTADIQLLSHVDQLGSVSRNTWPITAVYLSMAVCLLGLWLNFRTLDQTLTRQTSGNMMMPLPTRLLPGWWYGLKIIRNRRSLSSASSGFAITVATSIAIAAKHLGAAGGAGWLLLPAVLAAAAACEVRGLTPRFKAAEFTLAPNRSRFVFGEFKPSLVVGYLIGLPLLVVLLGSRVQTPATLVSFYLGLQSAAVGLGLLASTMLVPGEGDLGSQFFGVVGATSALLFLPKYAHFQNASLPLQTVYWLAVTAICFGAAIIIENQRKLRYGSA